MMGKDYKEWKLKRGKIIGRKRWGPQDTPVWIFMAVPKDDRPVQEFRSREKAKLYLECLF